MDKLFKKINLFLVSLSLFSNIVYPLSLFFLFESNTPAKPAYAKEEVVEESSIETLTSEETPSIDPTPTPTPTIIVEETLPIDPISTPAPTTIITTENTPAATESSDSTVEATPSAEPVFDQTPEQQVQILEVDLTTIEESSAQLVSSVITDKTDYYPGEVVLISAQGLEANREYLLRISSENEPATVTEIGVSSDENGSFTYSHQLDTNYRPKYLVEILLGNIIVASTTFTDAPVGNDLKSHEVWQPTDSTWVPGQPKGYTEGESGAFKVEVVTGDSVSNPLEFDICLEHYNSVKDAYAFTDLTAWNLDYSPTLPSGYAVTDNSNPLVYASNATINSVTPNGLGGGLCDADYLGWTVNFDQPNNTTAYILYGGHIAAPGDTISGGTVPFGKSASNINGTFQARVQSSGSGDKTVNFKSNDIIPVGNLTIRKITDPSSDTSTEFFFTGDLSEFSLIGNDSEQLFGPLDVGTYNISEAPKTGWDLTEIQCTGDSDGGSVIDSSGRQVDIDLDDGENIICTFTNTLQKSSLTLEKIVTNDDGGKETESSFQAYIDANPVNWNSKTELPAGDYIVSESDPSLLGYSSLGWGGDCTSDGNVTLAPGEDKICTITNDDEPASITITKLVVNDNGGTSEVSDFKLQVDDLLVNSGQTNYFAAGDYTVSEDNLFGYTPSLWGGDCDPNGEISLLLGQDYFCNITNDDISPKLIVYKEVINDNGGRAVPGDFTINVSGTNVSISSFGGSDTGTEILLNSGEYSVDEIDDPNYSKTPSPDCSGTISVGETKYCTITNDDISSSLKLTKEVVNDDGGVSTSSDWTLGAKTLCAFGDTSSTCSFSDTGDSETFHPITAGKRYFLSESGPDGYTASNWRCDGGEMSNGRLTVGLNEQVTCTITNDDIAPLLTVTKIVNGGDAQVSDFTLKANDTEMISGTAKALTAGSYNVHEEGQYVDDYSAVFSGDCDQSGNVDLSISDVKSCTITNTVRPGSITIRKEIIPQGRRQIFNFEILGQSGSSVQLRGGESSLKDNLIPGIYSITETVPENWDLTSAECIEGDSRPFDPRADGFEVRPGSDIVCTFTNTQRGELIVTKYNDANGDGQMGRTEETLPDWTMNLSNQNQFFESQITGINGEATFTNLIPGTYTLSETLKDGWNQRELWCDKTPISEDRAFLFREIQTENLRIDPGTRTSCRIGNQQDPQLTISKSNDASTAKSSGETVTYFLTLNLTGSNLQNVQVIDLPPKDFDYQSGSWTAYSNIRGNIKSSVTTEPTYASPGTWTVGEMVPGETVTLSYKALIDLPNDPGVYKDLALAYGCLDGEKCEIGTSNTLMAEGINSTYVNDYLVGTNVTLNAENTSEASMDVEKEEEGEVLGISTTLPATGASLNWLVIFLSLISLGILFIKKGLKLNKKTSTALILAGLISIFGYISPNKAYAVTDPNIAIRIEQPQSPTRKKEFSITYTVLDILDRAPVITCFQKGPGDLTYTQFGLSETLINGGTSSTCDVTSDVIDQKGTYQFYITADSGSGAEQSSIVSVEYNDDTPDKPTSYSREHQSECKNLIKFHTASDNGRTNQIEIYRSDQTSFNLNSGSRITTINIGSDQYGEYLDSIPSDCNKDWYYAIRAVSSTGAASDPVGDETIIFSTTTTEEIVTTSAAVPVAEDESLVFQPTESAEITPEDTVISPESTSGGVLGEQSGKGLLSQYRTPLIVILVIALSYLFYRRKRIEKD